MEKVIITYLTNFLILSLFFYERKSFPLFSDTNHLPGPNNIQDPQPCAQPLATSKSCEMQGGKRAELFDEGHVPEERIQREKILKK